jgi:hypothetical protein
MCVGASTVTERRSPFRPSGDGPVEVACRVCFAYVHLEPDRIFRAGEYDDAYWAFTCPHCGGSFPVRDDDVPEEVRHPHVG